ncbi:hypothetical protein SAMN05428961_11729 [Paenibacillus sp. OK060]|uniref:hypothetical protein n=1 Tax=Paenibacillus sp. OK060 TaxID=1881034 RepID=UPI000881A8B2|nr:hypothetical protein [Paenibacillus sp. OK060]SDM42449.1 hypothetical protein SAMN05428961_11729 [Paenibacillus sp. OK060]
MERIIHCRDFFKLSDEEHIDIDVAFRFNGANVYTSEGQLVIESIKEINEIDGPHEIKRYIRPDLLVIEGILSYFTGHLFTVYQLSRSEQRIVDDESKFPEGGDSQGKFFF